MNTVSRDCLLTAAVILIISLQLWKRGIRAQNLQPFILHSRRETSWFNALQALDPGNTGLIPFARLQLLLSQPPEALTEKEMEDMFTFAKGEKLIVDE